MADPQTNGEFVETHLGIFLAWAAKRGPNTAVADNARHAAESMVAAVRRLCMDDKAIAAQLELMEEIMRLRAENEEMRKKLIGMRGYV